MKRHIAGQPEQTWLLRLSLICGTLWWNHLPWVVLADWVPGNACMGRKKVIWMAGWRFSHGLQHVEDSPAVCISPLWTHVRSGPSGTAERNYRTVFRTSCYPSTISTLWWCFWDLPELLIALGEEWLVEGSCRIEGGMVAMLWTSTNCQMVMRKTRTGLEFPWFLQRMSSAVGGLAAAGTPSDESQEAFSEERSKNCASAALVRVFRSFWRPFCRHAVPAPPSSLSHIGCLWGLPSSISSSSSLLWWFREWGKTVRSGQMLLRQ